MSRRVFISSICSVIAVAVIMIAAMMVFLLTDLISFNKIELKIVSSSATAEYTGRPLMSEEWTLVSGELEEGHELDVSVMGVQTLVGASENYLEAKVFDEDGNDVTDRYAIEYETGLLKVIQRPIVIEASSATKKYDGEPLYSPDIVPPTALNYGHSVVPVVEGSRTEIGESPNRVTSATILDAHKNDVTKYYSITYLDGTLTVEEGDDLPPEEENGSKAPFLINTNTSGALYLKTKSYATYHGNSWGPATEYSELMLDFASAFYLAPKAAEYGGAVPACLQIKSNCDVYVLPYYVHEGDESVQRGDAVVTGDISLPYTVYYFTDMTAAKLPKMLKEYELAYREFVKAQYLPTMDQSTQSFMQSIINTHSANFKNADGLVDIAAVAEYVKGVGTLTQDYDKSLDASGNMAVEFFVRKEGTAKHFATAATMLYRALGVPARYTEGYAGIVGTENTEIEVYEDRAHAWVEVYLDGIGWICVDPTGTLRSMETSTGEDFPGSGEGDEDVPPIHGGLPENYGKADEGDEEDGPRGGGLDGNIGGGGPKEPAQDMFLIESSYGGTIYLKTESFGDYDVRNAKFLKAIEYDRYITAADRSAYYLVPYGLENAGKTLRTLTIEPKAGIFALPYYTFYGGGIQKSDTLMIGDATVSSYTAQYYSWQGTSAASVQLPTEYRDFEAAYAQFVKEQYLTIDDETRAFMNGIIAKKGFKTSDSTLINAVAAYIRGAAKYNLDYDRKLDEEANVIIAFLDKETYGYGEGICSHYAAAATMLYRALGIPARFTVGFMAQNVKANEPTLVTNLDAHAWVEVYLEGLGWVNVEVTGSDDDEDDKLEGGEFTVQPVDRAERYEDGKVLSPSGLLTGLEKLTANGYTYDATVSGVLTSPGKIRTRVTELLIISPKGELVYQESTGLGKDKFFFTYKEGTLHLYLDILQFTSVGDKETKVYDGVALETDSSKITMIGGTLADGQAVLTATGSITDVGTISSTFEVVIMKGGVDCTDHYKIERTYGTLTVTARDITVKAGSETRKYNGKPLTCNEIEYDPDDLAKGDEIVAYVVKPANEKPPISPGSKTSNVLEVGSVRIENADGKDVTHNYNIECESGLLTVLENK